MDRIETRLRQAAEETREAAPGPVPPSLRQQPDRRTAGWLVLATAFAAVLLVFAVPVLLGGSDAPLGEDPRPIQSPPTSVGADTTVTMIDDTPRQCSAEGAPGPSLSTDLPAEVVAAARAIIDAASDCDFDGLAGVASVDGSPDVATSFGGGGVENLARWEEEGYGEMDTLIRLFGTTHVVIENEAGPQLYIWPAATAYDSWDDIPGEYLAELIDLGVYTEGELDELAKFGSYAGWRVGIDEEGNWRYFIAGD